MFIYVIVNSETLKIYIGQHKGTNLRQYLQQKISEANRRISKRSRLYASMRKHSKEFWSIHPLIANLQTREECNYWEKLLIRALHTQHVEIGYNICPGGESAPHGNDHGHGNKGRVMSDTWRQRMSESAKRRFSDPQERLKHSEAHKGKSMPPRSYIHRQHLSEALMGRKASAEQILHQSLAQKGRPKPSRSEEYRRHISEAQKVRWAKKRLSVS